MKTKTMDNHFHILLEVPPMDEGGISDEVLLKRLSVEIDLVQNAKTVRGGRSAEGNRLNDEG